MIREFNHIGIRIRHAETVSFYRDLLGGQVTDEAYIASSATKCIHFQLADGLIEFLQPEQPSAETVFGLDHIAYMVDDLDEAHRRLAGAGYVFSVPPKISGSGRGRIAFLSDPNGVRVELIQREPNFRIPRITEGPVRGFDYVSLYVDDVEAAERFYTGFMEMARLSNVPAAASGPSTAYLAREDAILQLLHSPVPPGSRRIGAIALRVDDAERTAEYLHSKGAALEPGFPQPDRSGLGRSAWLRDPEGNKIEIVDRQDLREPQGI